MESRVTLATRVRNFDPFLLPRAAILWTLPPVQTGPVIGGSSTPWTRAISDFMPALPGGVGAGDSRRPPDRLDPQTKPVDFDVAGHRDQRRLSAAPGERRRGSAGSHWPAAGPVPALERPYAGDRRSLGRAYRPRPPIGLAELVKDGLGADAGLGGDAGDCAPLLRRWPLSRRSSRSCAHAAEPRTVTRTDAGPAVPDGSVSRNEPQLTPGPCSSRDCSNSTAVHGE